MPTLYDILGVPETASADELRHAYYRAARRLHPDVNRDADTNDDMRRLNQAWTVLGDPLARRAYDRELQAPPVPLIAPVNPAEPAEAHYPEEAVPAFGRLLRPSALIVAVLLIIFVVTAYAGPKANDRNSVPPATTGPAGSAGPAPTTALPPGVAAAGGHIGQCLRILPGYDAVVPCAAANDGQVVDEVTASSQCPPNTRAYQLEGTVEIVCLSPGG